MFKFDNETFDPSPPCLNAHSNTSCNKATNLIIVTKGNAWETTIGLFLPTFDDHLPTGNVERPFVRTECVAWVSGRLRRWSACPCSSNCIWIAALTQKSLFDFFEGFSQADDVIDQSQNHSTNNSDNVYSYSKATTEGDASQMKSWLLDNMTI